jgi:hypothetical protein
MRMSYISSWSAAKGSDDTAASPSTAPAAAAAGLLEHPLGGGPALAGCRLERTKMGLFARLRTNGIKRTKNPSLMPQKGNEARN